MRHLTSLIIVLTVAAGVLRGDQTVRQPTGGPIIENPVGSSEIFKCGGDQTLPNPIPVRWTTVVLAGDGRLLVARPGAGQLDHDPKIHPEHRENRENELLGIRGQLERDPEVRWRLVQARVRLRGLPGEEVDPTASEKEPSAIGRFVRTSGGAVISPACNGVTQIFGTGTYPKRWSPGWLFRLMLDANPGIQLEAAYALGVQLSQVDLEPDLMTAAIREARACNMRPIDDSVAAALLEVVGLANYTDDDQRTEAEQFLVRETQGSQPRILGAMRGLEAFIRRDPQRVRDERTRVRLRELAVYGQRIGEPQSNDLSAMIRRLAMQSLMAMGDTDTAMLDRASQDGDWQVRRLIAGRLSLATPYEMGLGQRFAADPAFQVRYDFLSSVGRRALRTQECAPIVPFFTDLEPTVVLRAIDVIPATCTDLDEVVIEKLTKLSEVLEKPYDKSSWHLPARAFAALARLKPEETKPRLSVVAKNDRWEVRMLIAGLAVTLGDVDTVMMLVRDPNPNVRQASLSAMSGQKSPLVVPLAIEALRDASDYHLLQTAALVLKGLPEEAKDDATEALLFALSRVTDQADDTSREARIAMIDRLAETMRPGRTADLQRYTFDFDDDVIDAARKSFEAILGVPPPLLNPPPLWRRYPYQPKEEELRSAPATAIIQLEEGFISMRLLSDVAPVTVARFAELARMGAYNDTTFYHVAPNVMVQAGSPAANDQSAPTKRFLRTEVGPQARHIRGAVGMWDHGRDSGDGQIFIDLVDQPHFDHQYTVFAYVTSGMELVDRLLEGAKIIAVTVK